MIARPTARAYITWGTAVLAYATAVLHRTSLAVVGVEAQQRFGATAGVLSLFAVVQLVVYAAMQIPVGVLVDRFGSRHVIMTGALLMAGGQLAMAFAETVPVALLARLLIGCGDAMTLISVIRLISTWFPGSRAPLLTQLTGVIGQLGQMLSASPLVLMLRSAGWAASFSVLGGVGIVVGCLVIVAVRDCSGGPPARNGTQRDVLVWAWRDPGTRLGLWAHLVTFFPGAAFAFLWGYPFLVTAQGLTPETAGLLLTAMAAIGMVVGPVLGGLVSRWPSCRSRLVLGIVAVTSIVWTVVLVWPGRAPLGLLIVLVVVLGSNAPGSMIGFDFARTSNIPGQLGTAFGIINACGFMGAVTAILGMGVILQLLAPGGLAGSTTQAFRWAFCVQYGLWAVGGWRFLRRCGLDRRGLPVDCVRTSSMGWPAGWRCR